MCERDLIVKKIINRFKNHFIPFYTVHLYSIKSGPTPHTPGPNYVTCDYVINFGRVISYDFDRGLDS